ncbi:MAG: AI-2E family transporter [Dehalococcoidia bacterium]|nr:AI-2E family transporter [Dehalococcoidia bacterium]
MDRETRSPADGDQPLDQRWFRRLDRWAGVGWRFIVIVLAIALAAWLVSQLRLILLPAVFAVFFCTVLVPIRNFYERARVGRTAAALLSALTGAAVLAVVILAIIPPIISEWEEIADSLQEAYDDIFQWLEEGPFGLTAEQGTNLRENVEAAQSAVLDGIASGAVEGLPIVVEVGTGILLAVVITFYFVLDGEGIWRWGVGLLPRHAQPRAHRAGARAWATLGRYLRGLAAVAIIDAIGIGLGAYIIGVPLAVPIAVLTLVTAFIPIVGAVAAGAVATLIAFANGGLADALWMIGVVVLVQQVESNIIQPALVGRSVDIHPLVVLLGVAAGSAIAGILWRHTRDPARGGPRRPAP